MFQLSQQEPCVLLSLLLASEGKSFQVIQAEFEKAFPERFRACCAALLLLEDPTVLRLSQRLAAWFLLAICDSGPNGASPFAALLAKAAGESTAPPVERNFLLQLLHGPLPAEIAEATPRSYVSYCDCRLLRTADWAALQQKALAGLLTPAAPAATPLECAAGADSRQQQRPQQSGSSALRPAGGPAGGAAGAPAPGVPGQQLRRDHPAGAASAATAVAAAAGPSTGGAAGGPGRALLAAIWERPSPAVLTPLPSELKWLNPDLHTELLWDSDLGEPSGQGAGGAGPAAGAGPGSASCQQARDLLAAALRGPLLPAQQQQLLAAWDADPRVVLRLGLTPRHLPALVEASPVVATEALLRLARWPDRYAAFLEVLARSDMSLHSLEVVNRLTANGAVPTEFVHLYVTNCIHSCESTQDKYVQNRLVRLVCVFLQSLIRNRVINIADLLHEVQAFCINFSRIREAAKLFRLIKQIEAGMRGNGTDESLSLSLPDAGSGSGMGPEGRGGDD
ncbi:hypothetical protein GPECTOR_43g967 [Gonium pectorale]|uniref:CCR4-NOT transcription complex subunit 11 n=1 Tax=Gonium pectorale TaxID=33097 RepID=A0A150GAZ1_GONPE|nr:hypothetical protein GPECTOR_43g967 [Gonium pectorale]|eukprot:KXZ46530.1 hypothetical protein GPECTOR_43g967 [Gonium pectorale]